MSVLIKLRIYRKVALGMIFVLVYQIVFPVAAFALTSGPSQPETQSFEPVGATEMVDLFSGDFNYNIPLFEVPGPNGGYPVNLFYHSVTNAEEEASMVGLGWNIGIGNISRQVRGLPDDFNGEKIKRKTDLKNNITWGLGLGVNFEFFGADFKKPTLGIGLGFNFFRNNYKGWGYSLSPDISMKFGKDADANSVNTSVGFGLNANLSSMDGASAGGSVSLSKNLHGADKSIEKGSSAGFGVQLHSRQGWSLNLTGGSTKKQKAKDPDPGQTNDNPSGSPATPPAQATESAGSSGVDTYNSRSFGVSSSNISPENDPLPVAVSMPFQGRNVSLSLKGGFGLWGAFANLSLSGFFNIQYLKNRNKDQFAEGFGYMYTHNATNSIRPKPEALMDFGRTGDASIIDNQPNLAVPYSTPDILSVSGHGIGGTFRAYRSDVPNFRNQRVTSVTAGGTLGVEIVPHFGIDGSGNLTISTSDMPGYTGLPGAALPEDNQLFEPYYFKHGGEMTSEIKNGSAGVDERIGDDKPVYQERSSFTLTNNVAGTTNFNQGKRNARKPRNNNIQPITNRQLMRSTSAGSEIMPEFRLGYYNAASNNTIEKTFYYSAQGNQTPTTTYNRAGQQPDQVGGYTILNDGGARWNYALPVKNLLQREYVFSIPPAPPANPYVCDPIVAVPTTNGQINYKHAGTDEYFNLTETPAYTSSYQLTSILGADFVDMPNDAIFPGDNDKGYWMRVEYLKRNTYKWRTPFVGANRMYGFKSVPNDEKGSFVYGEREQYYPAKIITRTHEALFCYSRREDARGANAEFQNPLTGCTNTNVGEYSYKLDSIQLYSRNQLSAGNNKLIKTVVFQYGPNPAQNSYLLCPGVHNNGLNSKAQGCNNLSGKLTLSKVYFRYENNFRGTLNAYKFEYYSDGTFVDEQGHTVLPGEYPYGDMAFDRWGIYRAQAGCNNVESPYVNENDPNIHKDARAWHLRKIKLPSGASINIEVERDDYAYVQDRVAANMFQVAGFGTSFDPNATTATLPNGALNAGDDKLKLYFKLERPTHDPAELDRYLSDLYEEKDNPQGNADAERGTQLYFKVRAKLANNSPWEDVTGYAYFDNIPNQNNYGFAGSPVNGEYRYGYIRLKPFPVPSKGNRYHPILMNNWQFLKINIPDQMHGYNYVVPSNPDDNTIKNSVKGLAGLFDEFKTIFTGYYAYCNDKNFGREVQLAHSYIRLNSPDMKKYGDGIRVKTIYLQDDWQQILSDGKPGEETPSYGQVYDYTAQESIVSPTTNASNTITRSSGVAQNEPAVGTDECALRYVKSYIEDLKYKQDQYQFIEYPLNEAYYPGASVGYEKVSVMSLPSYVALKKAQADQLSGAEKDLALENLQHLEEKWFGSPLGDYGFSTSGMVQHEFYTAKDFPVIARESQVSDKKLNIFAPIPLIGLLTHTQYTGTQGYTIELNNMHGRVKKVTNYGQDKVGNMINQPLSYVRYEYNCHDEMYTLGNKTRTRKVLDNEVDILDDNYNKQKAEMGVDRELFFDHRHAFSEGANVGGNGNLDWIFILFGSIPIPTGWPSIFQQSTDVLTSVANKAIYKSGILVKTEAKDGQSVVTTENRVFDRYSGQPLLTITNNLFDDPLYNLTIPAHLAYKGMAPAYENWGLTLNRLLNQENSEWFINAAETPALSNDVRNKINEGDEFILSLFTSPPSTAPIARTKATVTFKCGDRYYLHLADPSIVSAGTRYYFFLVRSGHRNQQSNEIGKVVALKDPTVPANRQICNAAVSLPRYFDGKATTSYEDVHFSFQKIDEVLNATATTYSDKWMNTVRKNVSTSGEKAIAVADPDPFAVGTRGIWKPNANFVYVENRKDDKTGTDFRKAGIYDEAAMFDWKNPFFQAAWSPTDHYCPTENKWKRTEDLTRYAENGSAIESRDVLGNYSGAIYGYNENVPVATGVNTSFHELGFEGFEEYFMNAPAQDVDLLNLGNNFQFTSGNIDIGYHGGTVNISKTIAETYNILGRIQIPANAGGVEVVLIDRNYFHESFFNGSSVLLDLKDKDGKEYYYTAVLNFMHQSTDLNFPAYTNKTWLVLANFKPFNATCTPNATLQGRVTLHKPLQMANPSLVSGGRVSPIQPGYAFVSNRAAHTGKNSLLIRNASVRFPQISLKPRPQTTYMVGAWVRVAGVPVYQYTTPTINVYVSNLAIPYTFLPSGPIIDGWQRIEGAFPITGIDTKVSIELAGVNSTGVFYDDLRVYPRLGNMQSFVYDLTNYRLTETLDNNNYFTRYIYNGEGNPVSVQKETQEGIRTTQESGAYVKEQQ